MPRSPRSTRPRSGRAGRSRPAGLPASAQHESSSRLLFTARLAPVSADVATDPPSEPEPEPAPEVDTEATPETLDLDLPVTTPAPTVPPPGGITGPQPPSEPAEPPTATVRDPATRVHANRLVAASPKLHLTPSQAVRLASDGRDVLTRARPRAS
ncbi:MAG: hypothetical protein WD378_09640 [Egicoccus sp.]